MGKGPATVRARYRKTRRYAAVAAATVMGAGLAVGATMTGANAASHTGAGAADSMVGSWSFGPGTATPIKHLVVIFQENISFDHYFGTYPHAANTNGQPFTALPGTRAGERASDQGPGGGTLLTNNPNGANPIRYNPTNVNDLLTCDQDHNYTDEQLAFNGGKMNKFISTVGTGSGTSPTGQPCQARDVLNYYDGNTVTGLWNYAQHFAMSDNSYGTTFGPSSPAPSTWPPVTPAGSTRPRKSAASPRTSRRRCDDGGRHRHADQRRAAVLRRLLEAATRSPSPARTSATCSTPADCPGAGSRGASPRRRLTRPQGLPAGTYDPLRHRPRACATSTRSAPPWAAPGSGASRRLHTAPPALRELRFDGEPAPPGPGVPAGGRARHSDYTNGKPNSTPPITSTPRATSTRSWSGIAAGKLSPTCSRWSASASARLPGRPRRLLRPDRRAAVHRQGDQRAGEDPGLVEHGGRHLLRRTPTGWYDHAFSGGASPTPPRVPPTR